MTTAMSDSRRARLAEYVPWILRDYATNQGPSTAIVILLIGVLTIVPVIQGMAGVQASVGDVPRELAARMLRAIAPMLAFIGTFFATNGIVANDRKFGFYRFLFAKPVRPPAYYAATYLVYGVGLLAVTVALLGIWSLAVRPMFPVELLGVVVIMYLAYGGIGFLLSAVWRFDWLSLVTVLLAANLGWSVWGDAEGLRHWVLYLLPPVHRAESIYAIILRDSTEALPWGSIAWLAGYGLICFVLGMLIIRKRPLGTS